MVNKLRRRDLEALSAYLDGELPPRQRARLEARLESDPALGSALEELRHTRAVLRSALVARAPRNFTLRADQVAQPAPASRLYPVMRYASAIATVLLVVVFIGDVLSGVGFPGAMALNAESQPALEMAVEAEGEAELPQTALAEGADVAADEGMVEAPAPSEKNVGATPMAFEAEPEGGYGGGGPSPTQPTLAAEDATEEAALPTLQAREVPLTPAAESLSEAAPADNEVSPFRIIEGLLGLTALLTGFMALLLRRGDL